MKKLVGFIKKAPVLLLTFFVLASLPACNRHDCPANNGGYMDKHKVVKRQSNKKPKSGLWPKNMKPH